MKDLYFDAFFATITFKEIQDALLSDTVIVFEDSKKEKVL